MGQRGKKKLDKGSWRQIERASGREKERATMAESKLKEREGEREEETGGGVLRGARSLHYEGWVGLLKAHAHTNTYIRSPWCYKPLSPRSTCLFTRGVLQCKAVTKAGTSQPVTEKIEHQTQGLCTYIVVMKFNWFQRDWNALECFHFKTKTSKKFMDQSAEQRAHYYHVYRLIWMDFILILDQ